MGKKAKDKAGVGRATRRTRAYSFAMSHRED